MTVLDGLTALDTALHEQPALSLHFYSYGILLHRRLPDGGETEYPVAPDQLATALAAKMHFETGVLSGNTIYLASEGVSRVVLEFRKPQQTALFLDGLEQPVRVPLPGLLMLRVTLGNDTPRYGVYAVKRRPTTLETPLFHAPLPNTDSRSICWGTVKKPSPEGLASLTLDEDWRLFLGSVFTNHSVGGKSKTHPADIRQKLIALDRSQARTYPVRDLIPLKMTLNDVLEKVRHEYV